MAIFDKPIHPANRARMESRSADELVGMCRGILSDGSVNQLEADFLLQWINRSAANVDEFPVSIVYRRLAEALSDGVLDADEEAALLDTLVSITGGETAKGESKSASRSTTLPLCDPPPQIDHGGANVVVTGTFECGSRKAVVCTLQDYGAIVQKNITKTTRYLIIGSIGSADWAHSSFGRKIELAVRYRDEGHGIGIVHEPHWVSFLRQ